MVAQPLFLSILTINCASVLTVQVLPEPFVLVSGKEKEILLLLISYTLLFCESCPSHFSMWLCHKALRMLSRRAPLKEEGVTATFSCL